MGASLLNHFFLRSIMKTVKSIFRTGLVLLGLVSFLESCGDDTDVKVKKIPKNSPAGTNDFEIPF